jgi:hypothetical protein
MQNPQQTAPLDDMVARLEKANALAYEQSARVEKVFKSERDVAPDPSDQQNPPPIPDRGSSLRRLALLALVGLLLAAPVCVAVFGWRSTYADAAKLIIARWANAELLRPAPPAAAPTSPELVQRLQTIAQDLANLEQRIEQLKSSQEQMVRDNMAVSQQLKAALAQTARDNAAIGEQLKASQQQLAVMQSFWALGLAQKPLPMRKPVPQAVTQPQVAPHLKPNEKH